MENYFNAIKGFGLIFGGAWSIYYQYKNPVKNDVNLFNIGGYIFGAIAILIGILLIVNEVFGE